jgi:imidazole glycerol-phosphate synthase subunit HisH
VPTVVVLDYGSGNLHSVGRALAHAGADAVVTADPAAALAADALLIPGVGHFGHCVRAIRSLGLDETIHRFVESGRPVVGVCVGMQVLFEGSEEDPDPGLGLLPGTCRRLPATVKVPHIGWNEVAWWSRHPLVERIDGGTRFYFVHSYAADVGDVAIGVAEHGRPFAAVAARDNVFATQFHPEKSSAAGLTIYANLVKELGG